MLFFLQADEEDTDADRVQKFFEDAFKGNLWAGGRVPNVMAELQRAILGGVLDLRSIEAHRLVCLSHNLHVKDLRQTRYTKSFVEFHKYLSILPSARATLLARRGREPQQPGELPDLGRPRFNEILMRQDYISREVRTSISSANDAGGALRGNVGCGQKVQGLEAFLSGLLRATEGGSTTDKAPDGDSSARRRGWDTQKGEISMTISKKTGLVLEGDECHPSVDEKVAALRRTMSDILMPMRQSLAAGLIITAEGETIVARCLTQAGAFVRRWMTSQLTWRRSTSCVPKSTLNVLGMQSCTDALCNCRQRHSVSSTPQMWNQSIFPIQNKRSSPTCFLSSRDRYLGCSKTMCLSRIQTGKTCHQFCVPVSHSSEHMPSQRLLWGRKLLAPPSCT